MGKNEIEMEGTMQLKTAVNTTFTQNSVFKWIIARYTVLEVERLYFQTYHRKGFSCVFKLIKAKNALFIAFRCGFTGADGTFYLSNGDPMSKLVKATEISQGLYFGEIPEALILHAKGLYQKTGVLHIGFRLIKDRVAETQYNPCGQIGVLSDLDELCHEVQSMHIDAVEEDFAIRVAGTSLAAHKCVLYARSEFFKEYFEKNGEAKEFPVPDTVPGIMYEALMYMYSGELSYLDTACMVKVLEVACLLQIQSLKDRCFRFFERTGSWDAIEKVQFFEYKIDE